MTLKQIDKLTYYIKDPSDKFGEGVLGNLELF